MNEELVAAVLEERAAMVEQWLRRHWQHSPIHPVRYIYPHGPSAEEVRCACGQSLRIQMRWSRAAVVIDAHEFSHS